MSIHFRSKLVKRSAAFLAMLSIPLLLLAAMMLLSNSAAASSHREAPLISQDAFADNTDTYVFVSPADPSRLVLVASWIPFEGPEGGPNYFEWGKDVLYDIHVDTNGDATSDVTYTLSSRVQVNNPNTFLYNVNSMTTPNDADWNRRQFITVTEVFAPGSAPAGTANVNLLVANKRTAPVNIGSKSTPDYSALEMRYRFNDANGPVRIFGGQTDDAFWVDLQVFDLLTLRGQAPPVGYSTGPNTPVDSVAGYNVHSLVVELPISRLTSAHGDPVVGVWATARRPSTTVLSAGSQATSGPPVQVSRLGMPLVNEVVLPMGLKDIFNGIAPSVDLTVYSALQESVEDPELGNLLCGLYGVPLPGDTGADCDTDYTAGTPRSGRGDIFDIFLTGMVLANPFTITTSSGPVMLPAGFNVNRPASVTPAEMIRINTSISGPLCSPTPSRLGVLGGDACGFPNGRRLSDDVVEIELLAVAGAAYEVLDDRDASFTFNPALISVLDDGVNANDVPFRNSFPYMAQAQSGQSHQHTNSTLLVATGLGALALAPLAGLFVWQRRKKRLLDTI
jgi:hypothetical protein